MHQHFSQTALLHANRVEIILLYLIPSLFPKVAKDQQLQSVVNKPVLQNTIET